jgi:large subunit ribosomal protein L23
MQSLSVILAPLISEKSMNEASKGRYSFKVAKQANKKDIKKAVEEKFKVNVLKVATVIIKGRSRKKGVRRVETLQASFKKAAVTLKSGQTISIFDQGAKASNE